MDPIDHLDFRAWDLNLVVALDALLQERSVSRAARRVGLGQPAMSHALSRLRTLLGDEVLVRGAGGMEPTPLALDIAGPVRQALLQIRETILERRPFDPAQARRTFFLGMTDYTEVLLLAPLVARVVLAAPGVQLVTRSVDRDRAPGLLDAGRIDAAVGIFSDVASRYCRAPLFLERYACLYDPSRLPLDLPLTLDSYAEALHVAVSPAEERTGPLDSVLSTLGVERRIVASTPRYGSVPPILKAAPLLATVPDRIARLASRVWTLVATEPPLDVPAFEVAVLWHRRDDRDPAHAWLREEISLVATTLSFCGQIGVRRS
jgi:DNA-binding transcriptional LysR family regulator